MEDLWKISYPYPPEPSSSSQAAACLHHGNIDTTNEGIQIRTAIQSVKFGQTGACTDVNANATAAAVCDVFATKSPHDYGLLGTASPGPRVQLDQIADDDSSPAVTRCWQKIVANVGAQGQTLTSSSRASSSFNSRNPFLRPTRNNRWKTAAGGGGYDLMARRCTENGHVHKLVERERRSTMKTLCSTLISLLPEEYHKTKQALSDQLLEAIKYIHHLQDTLIELENKRDGLNLSVTVKQFSNSSSVYKNLQPSQARPSNVSETFPTIRVSKFGSGIQVTADSFRNQSDFSTLLLVLEEAGVEVVSASVSAINDKVFCSIHSKLSEFLHFDSAVVHGRIDQLMKEKFPPNLLLG